MESNLGFCKIALGVFSLLLFINSNLFSQSSFSYKETDSRRYIGLVSYSGNLKSVSDRDTVELQGFTYQSVGQFKKLTSVANGCVYVLIEYPQKQFIFIKSDSAQFIPTFEHIEWIDANESKLNSCLIPADQLRTSKKRRKSLYKEDGSVTLAILNVKEKNLAVFMDMAESVSFN